MKHINEMTLTIKAMSQNESFARSVVAAFCVPLNPTIEQINDIKTAVSEAVTNAIVHAYEYKGGDIVIWAGLSEKALHIKISDTGKGINNVDEALQPFYTTKPEEERSGMGFTVMQTFCDKVQVESSVGKGTTVTLYKDLQQRSERFDA